MSFHIRRLPPRLSVRRSARFFGPRILVALLVVIWLMPTIGLLVTSFRPTPEIDATGWWNAVLEPFSHQWTIDNYTQVFEQTGIGLAIFNSLAVAVPSTLFPIVIGAFTAYGLVYLRFPGRSALMAANVGLLVVPLQIALIPVLRLYVAVGLAGTFVGIWVVHTAFAIPLTVFLIREYMASSVPMEIVEAARIDGADHMQTFAHLIVPLTMPILAAVGIFQFIWVFNDLLVTLVFLGGGADVATLTVSITQLNGPYGETWQLLTAAAFVSMALPLVVFFLLQRYFVRGLTAGAVK